MKLGIMQPYFFPYLGYFDLIHYADKWIVFDTVQFIRHGWINRNRILHPHDGWQYIVVPLKKHSRESAIKDVVISSEQKWRQRIMGQLNHYKKRAPFFQETICLVDEVLQTEEPSVSRLDVVALEKACAYLGISFDFQFFSEMKLELGPVEEPGDWALQVSTAVGAREYVNPPGGEDLFDEQRFADNDITLTIRPIPSFEYQTGGYGFVPNLSIIDLLMWNEPAKIKRYLDANDATH